jgi:hypothetical protein
MSGLNVVEVVSFLFNPWFNGNDTSLVVNDPMEAGRIYKCTSFQTFLCG